MGITEIIEKLQILKSEFSEEIDILSINIEDNTYIHIIYKFKDNDNIYKWAF